MVAAPGDTALTVLTAREASEELPAVSPDERWLAYASDVSGATEVYVRTFGRAGAPVVVSVGGGTDPRWSRRGDELFYRQGARVMAGPRASGRHLRDPRDAGRSGKAASGRC